MSRFYDFLFRLVGSVNAVPNRASNRALLIGAEQGNIPKPYVFMDTETTGLNREGTDEIVEIAIVDESGDTLLNTLVCPVHLKTWPQAQQIHGISPDDVKYSPPFESLLPKIYEICKNKTVIFYNAAFDTSFFPDGFFSSHDCAMQKFSEVSPDAGRWVSLSVAAQLTHYQNKGISHRALDDARACRHIWMHSINVLEKQFPVIANPKIHVTFGTEGRHLNFDLDQLFSNELRFIDKGDRCDIWTNSDREEMTIFRPHPFAGRSRLAVLRKSKNPDLALLLETANYDLLLIARIENSFFFEVVIKKKRSR